MVDVCPLELGAGRAWTARLQRLLVLAELRIADVEWTVGGERLPRASRSRRKHAIEHVNSAPNCFDDVVGLADAHQVTRLVLGKLAGSIIEASAHCVVPLAHRQSTDRIAIETDVDQRIG